MERGYGGGNVSAERIEEMVFKRAEGCVEHGWIFEVGQELIGIL